MFEFLFQYPAFIYSSKMYKTQTTTYPLRKALSSGLFLISCSDGIHYVLGDNILSGAFLIVRNISLVVRTKYSYE